jgi:hypothetical protein
MRYGWNIVRVWTNIHDRDATTKRDALPGRPIVPVNLHRKIVWIVTVGNVKS